MPIFSLVDSICANSNPNYEWPKYNPATFQDPFLNYCKIVKAAYYYGDLSTHNKSSLSIDEVNFFNGLWKQAFSEPYFQSGIGTQEFNTAGIFREGNRIPFPSSAMYHQKNPDVYQLFHIVKEIGRIRSQAFGSCATCIIESITKINSLLERSYLHKMVSDIWLGPGILKKITNTNEVNSLWLFLRCLFVDDLIFPNAEPFTVNLKPLLTCPDTTIITCKDAIVPEVTVAWRHCDIGGKVETIGPKLISGIDNCPGARYRFTFIAKDQCLRVDSVWQFFKIVNDPPEIDCPTDTVVFCIEELVKIQPKTTTSCDVTCKVTYYGPLLVSGTHNCPGAIYEMQYIVKDICGRETKCIQKVKIENDPPMIMCPADTIVECFEDIKPGNPMVLMGRVDLGNFTPSLSQNRIPIFGTGCESLPSYGSSLSNLYYPDFNLF